MAARRKKPQQDTLHESKIAEREFGDRTQYRAECSGCDFTGTWYSVRALATDGARYHADGVRKERDR